MAISLELPGSVDILNAVPVDPRFGPYASQGDALLGVPLSLRYPGRTVMVIGSGEYWWPTADVSDPGLVAKTNAGSGGTYTAGNGIAITSGRIALDLSDFSAPTGEQIKLAADSFDYNALGNILTQAGGYLATYASDFIQQTSEVDFRNIANASLYLQAANNLDFQAGSGLKISLAGQVGEAGECLMSDGDGNVIWGQNPVSNPSSNIYTEYFAGDGVTTTFATAHPISAVLLCGAGSLLASDNEFTHASTTFTLAVAPAVGEKAIIVYSDSQSLLTEYFDGDGVQTTFTTAFPITQLISCGAGGLWADNTGHTHTSTTFTLSNAPLTGEKAFILYR